MTSYLSSIASTSSGLQSAKKTLGLYCVVTLKLSHSPYVNPFLTSKVKGITSAHLLR